MQLPPGWRTPVEGKIFAMAPMVGQSDFPFRQLIRGYGATICYTEMFVASTFARSKSYRKCCFGNGVRDEDHPLICQLAANDPEDFRVSALYAQNMGCDGIDLNLGCPQRRAMEGHYGSYMTEKYDWQLCYDVIHCAANDEKIRIPITAKIRLQQSVEETIAFVRLLSSAGASMITIHGRYRGCESQRRQGAADLEHVRAVVQSLRATAVCPILTNGNVACSGDVTRNLEYTGADGIMVAEELLRNPALFSMARGIQSLSMNQIVSPNIKFQRRLDRLEEYFIFLENLVDNATNFGIAYDSAALEHDDTSSTLKERVVDRVQCHAGEHNIVGHRIGLMTARLQIEDGSIDKKSGGAVRPALPDDRCDEEVERMSVWWNNTEVCYSPWYNNTHFFFFCEDSCN